jgi:hypothetical protein
MDRLSSFNTKLTKGLETYLAPILLLVFVAVEFYAKFQRYVAQTTNLQQIIKGIVFIGLGSLLLWHFKKTKKLLIGILLLAVIFTIGQLSLDSGFSKENLVVFSRFLFPLVLFGCFNVYKPNAHARALLFRCFEGFLLVNIALMLWGLFTQTYVLKTYLGDRFGFNGLLITSATSTYVYLCALGYFYFKNPDSFYKKLLFWITVCSCLIVGTKTLYLGVLLFALLVFINGRFLYKRPLTLVGISALIVGIYFLFYKVPIFREIQENEGLLTAALSYRDQLLLNQTFPYIQENWSFLNFLFGGTSDFSLRSQMDLFDVLYFWGILGALLYFWSYFTAYFTFKLNRRTLFFFLLMAFAVLLSGNFFTYTSIPIYLVILREALISQRLD